MKRTTSLVLAALLMPALWQTGMCNGLGAAAGPVPDQPPAARLSEPTVLHAPGQLDTLRYDDGSPVYARDYEPGDTVLIWFNPSSVCSLEAVQLLFESSASIVLHVWKDAIDTTGELFDDDLIYPQPYYVTTDPYPVWTEIDLSGFHMTVEDSSGVYIGYELGPSGSDPRILSDSSTTDSLHSFSLKTGSAGRGWYPVGTDTTCVDLMAGLVVRYAGMAFEAPPQQSGPESIPHPEADRDISTAEGKRYAVLLGCIPDLCSGDVRMAFSDLRKHGYADDDIWVAYGPGNSGLGDDLDGAGAADDIDGTAKRADIKKIFDTWLPGKTLVAADQVFIYISSHGNTRKCGGKVGWKGWFETWDQPDGKDNDKYFASVLNEQIGKLTCGKVIVVTDFCHDGHFARALTRKTPPERMILTATLSTRSCWDFSREGKTLDGTAADFDYGCFSAGFFSAVCGYKPNFRGYPGKLSKKRPVCADTPPKDRQVSMYEAFKWAEEEKDKWDGKDNAKPWYEETSDNLLKTTFLWESPKKPEADKDGKKRPKKPKADDKLQVITEQSFGDEYEYLVAVRNTSVVRVQKVVETIAAEDLIGGGTLVVERPFVAPPVHWEVSVSEVGCGDTEIVWSLSEAYADEWGIIAFGCGEAVFPYWYDYEDLLWTAQTLEFYDAYDDSLGNPFADTTLASGGQYGQVGINECMPNPVYGNDEWLEIHNWGTASVDLTGWRIAHKDSIVADSLHLVEPVPSIVLPAGGYYSIQWSGDSLLDNRDVLCLLAADGSIVDKVHWDEEDLYEGSAPEGYSLACDIDGSNATWEWTQDPSPDSTNVNSGIEVIALGHKTGPPDMAVVVDFCVWNTGPIADIYDVSLEDTQGWEITPEDFSLDLPAGQDTLISATVTVPYGEPGGTVDWLVATAGSHTRPTLQDQASSAVTVDESASGIDPGEASPTPAEVIVLQTSPNPFRSVAEIRYALTGDCNVKVEIFDIMGRRVATLVDGKREAGHRTVLWEADNPAGNPITSGIYFCRLTACGSTRTEKIVLLK